MIFSTYGRVLCGEKEQLELLRDEGRESKARNMELQEQFYLRFLHRETEVTLWNLLVVY